ncbi:MAG: bifunctional ADP-heptose synthase [Myxococcota bacterium]
MTAPDPALLNRLHGVPLAVWGHAVLDRYLYGVTDRISREAPVLIVKEESEACFLGGAGNTAANLVGLGAQAYLVSPVGRDPESDRLARLCADTGIPDTGLIRSALASTTTKTRILAGGLHTTRQQMLRIDRESEAPLERAALRAFERAALDTLDHVRGVIVSDYGAGTLTPLLRTLGQEAQSRGLPVVVDSRRGILEFSGMTAVTPNAPEAEAALGRRLRSTDDAVSAACELRERLELESALLTRGREGMVLATAGKPPLVVPAEGGDAVDVTGAGDTVVATFSTGLAAGLGPRDSALLANQAASIVVQKTGTAPIADAELRALLTEPNQ